MSENTERDKLAEVIRLNTHTTDGFEFIGTLTPEEQADAILAAGYRKVAGLVFPAGYVPSEHVEEVCCEGIVLCEECLSCGDPEATL